MTLEELTKQIKQCQRCPLRGEATQPVPGLGEVGAKYFIIGEAPGRSEDDAGVPFVGLAGKRLNKLIALAGIDINDCYVTNTVKCRPPVNRQPRKSERLACYNWLREELALVKPETIITLGAIPLSLFSSAGITQMHGTQFVTDGGLIVIAQYHPAAALHQPRMWSVMLDDWQNMPKKVDASYTVSDLPKDLYPRVFALDTENDELGRLGAWSIAYRDEGRLLVTPYHGIRQTFRPTERSTVVMHNARWDIRVLQANKMLAPPTVVDTMIAAYCLGLARQDVKDATRSGSQMIGGLGLKYLARRHLGIEMKTWEEVKDKPDELAEYNAKDAVATLLLWEQWEPKLPKHFWQIDMPLLAVCIAMEDRGIMVDPNFLQKYAETLDEKLSNVDLSVDGTPINPFSHKQVSDYIYGRLGYKPTKFTDNKQPSVDKEVLEAIDDPIVRHILEYREFYKERRTYVSNYLDKMGLDNRIHCDFKQTSTATGRLSSARPNLQNVTKNTELRKLFVAEAGSLLVRVDFSQLELRVFAALTQDPVMLKAFAEGKNIHQETADILGVSYDDAKTINFLMLYGGGAWKISQEFGVPVDKAKAMIARYYATYPKIKAYHDEMIEKAHSERKVTNFFGRTRRLDGMYSEDWKTIKDSEREAINTPIQGTAADVVKLVMIDLHYKHQTPMILQVHDELLFEVAEGETTDYAQWLKDYIPTLVEINGVRFPVEVGIGKNWMEAMKNGKS